MADTEDRAELHISFAKRTDGTVVLRCTRADGSSTWQKQDRGHFLYHDLTHYAVETTLGLRQAFYGLLADGWDIEDFGSPWPRGKLTPEQADDAGLAELLAGAFDLERTNGVTLTATTFNENARTHAANYDAAPPSRAVSEAEVQAIRATLAGLIADWERVPPGGTLELRFNPSARP